MSTEIAIGLHLYQPLRTVSHKNLSGIKTDLEKFRESGKDWTQIINEECYSHLAKKDVLKSVSYTFYGTLQEQLEKIDPQTSGIFVKHLKENGVGHPDIHPILPDLTLEAKKILVGAGIKRMGFVPKYFWAPEGGMDYETLMVLKEFGYQGVVCAPEQLIYEKEDPVKPMTIELPNCETILALPFNRPLSQAIAFAHPGEWNADHFADNFIMPEAQKPDTGNLLLGWTDGETFGWHNKKFNADFLWWLLNVSLPERGLKPVRLNEIDTSKSGIAVFREKTSWSCPHGLTRWHGACSCSKGDLRWKAPFYRAHKKLDHNIETAVKKELGLNGEKFIEKMIECFPKHFKNPGPPHTTPDLSAISAYVSAKTARTSCGTFFDDPHFSGKINLLFALQSLEHLKDSGQTKQAAMIEEEYKKSLSSIPDPVNPGKTVLDMLYGLLNQ